MPKLVGINKLSASSCFESWRWVGPGGKREQCCFYTASHRKDLHNVVFFFFFFFLLFRFVEQIILPADLALLRDQSLLS